MEAHAPATDDVPPEAEVVDTTADELPPLPSDDMPIPAVGMALAPRVTNEVIRPLDPTAVKAAMVEHQELLRQILDDSDWQGRPDAQGSFVKKSGWRKIALAYNLAIERVGETVERDLDGKPLRASYTARATAPNGRAMEATGHCSFDESRFSGPRGNTSKLENDMRATAETRAKNRAISDLIGMGKVSAEEVDAGAGHPPYGDAAEQELVQKLSNALMFLFDADATKAAASFDAIKTTCGGYVPKATAETVVAVIAAYRDHETAQQDGADEPVAADNETKE